MRTPRPSPVEPSLAGPAPADRAPARWHDRLRTLIAVVAVTLLVGACTGTSEERSSTLLIVGVQEGAEFQLALVEDQADGTAAADRMRFVADSRRPLPAPAVAIDLTARDTDRSEAFVLTRSVAGTEVNAYLHRFSVANVRAEAPSAFDEIGEPLSLVGPDGVLSSTATTNSIVCPSTLQVSRDGRWLLLLDVPAECVASTADFPVVWLLDMAGGAATVLEGSNDVLGAGIYTDQRQDGERGYFLVGGTTNTQVFATDFESGRADPFQDRTVAVAQQDLVAMVGSGDRLMVLTRDSLVGTDLSLPSLEAELGPVPALANARTLVVDQVGRLDSVLVVGASQAELHARVERDAPDPERLTLAAAGATVEPLRAYTYVLRPGVIEPLDLYTIGQEGGVSSRPFPLPELLLPTGPGGRPLGAISWIRAADPLPTP